MTTEEQVLAAMPPSEPPVGAIENGREHFRRLVEHYEFECEGGLLRNCSDFQDALRCFEFLAESAMIAASEPENAAGSGTAEDVIRDGSALPDSNKGLKLCARCSGVVAPYDWETILADAKADAIERGDYRQEDMP